MALGKRQRKFLKGVFIALAGLLVLIVAFPVWFPWVLRPVLRKAGLQYAAYDRLGYTRFALRGLTYADPDVKVRVDNVEAWTPLTWLWHRVTGTLNVGSFAQISGWHVQVLENNLSTGEGSVYKSFGDVADVVTIVKKWVPTAVVSNGFFHDRKLNLNVLSARWADEKLIATALLSNSAGGFVVTAGFNNPTSGTVHIESDHLKFGLDGQVSADSSALKIQTTSFWQSNRIDTDVAFGRKGTLPETVTLRAPTVVVPSEIAGLPEYQPISGSVTGTWANGEFVVDVHAMGQPQTAQTNLPPATLQIRVRGNTNSAQIESATVSAPWLNAELSRGLQVHYTGQLLREPAAFKFSADLNKQPWVTLTGDLKGEADLSPGTGKIPDARFRVTGTNVGNADLEARTFEANGSLQWPLLKISSAHAEFADNSAAAVSGNMDLEKRALSGGSFSFGGARQVSGRSSPDSAAAADDLDESELDSARTPSAILAGLLPDGYECDNLTITGKFEGPLTSSAPATAHSTWVITNVSHSGRFEIRRFAGPDIRPLHIRGGWAGQGIEFRETELTASTTNSILIASGSLRAGTNGLIAILNRLSLTNHSQQAMNLRAPADFSFNTTKTSTKRWHAQIESFDWQGTAGTLQAQGAVDWPRAGNLRCVAERIRYDLLQDFFNSQSPDGQIEKLSASGAWSNGPANFGIELSGVIVPPKEFGNAVIVSRAETENSGSLAAPSRSRPPPSRENQAEPSGPPALLPNLIDFDLRLHGDQSGLTLSNLAVNSQTSAVAIAHGFLPLTIIPGQQSNLWHLDPARPLLVSAHSEPNSFFWSKVADWTGINLRDPKAEVDVSGTWKKPEGEVRVTAQQIQMRKPNASIPTVENVQLGLLLDRDMARLTNCQMLIQGQPLTITGEMPLGDDFWQKLPDKRLPNWEKASARARIVDAEISGFAPLLPEIVSPAGTLNLEVSLQPGGNLSGDLKIQGARTRSLPEVGAIRDINCNLRFEHQTVKLSSVTARIGGAPVLISGQVDLKENNWLRGQVPPFEVLVTGTNVPLSRHPDSIVRSDLNLTIRKTNAAPALIAGEARLRNSYYLSDLSDLLPGQVASPEQRPPYFSITDEPLAGWRLAVTVIGQRALRVRSTIFSGEVSAHLNLTGTLKDPLALGDARIESGTVRFPFASLKVQQGFVTLSSQDPYHPQLQVTATSKEYGYDINMSVTGPADAPIVQFTSVPPLTSEQIVLLVTAGNVPSQTHLSTQQRAQTMAVFFGRDLLTTLGFSDSGEPRLSFHSGQEVTDEGKPTYNLEYRLNDRWSLVGEYDRFNAFNAGVKWRIYSK
jgi:translocation and assembly module TamB